MNEGIKIVSPEEFEANKKKLEERMMNDIEPRETKNYTSLDINWIGGLNSWKDVKNKNLDLILKSFRDKLFFIAHSQDIVSGKPQLVENNLRKIILIRKVLKMKKEKKVSEPTYITQFKFLGDFFDSRYDGKVQEVLALDFWIYRIVSENGKEYYILSQKKLPNEICEFKGMLIELDDLAELSRNMKIKSLTNVFLVKEFEPSVKIISKERLIEYTKNNNITEQDWLDFLAYHPNGNLNRFPKDSELFRSAFILSGKVDGYPLHPLWMGKAGTKKTMGLIETTGYKIAEEPSICEGANSRIKGLSPSFKEKPADIGFLAKANRIGLIDEIGKMVEVELNKHEVAIGNVLGELNFLLEHKKRSVSSGNNNECQVQATAKFMFVTNPVGNRETIHQHIGAIDPTTMSRMAIWVQDDEETKFCLSKEAIGGLK